MWFGSVLLTRRVCTMFFFFKGKEDVGISFSIMPKKPQTLKPESRSPRKMAWSREVLRNEIIQSLLLHSSFCSILYSLCRITVPIEMFLFLFLSKHILSGHFTRLPSPTDTPTLL